MRGSADELDRILLCEAEIDEELAIVNLDGQILALTGVLSGSVKWSVRTVSFG